ncbi:MAG: amino acid permease [Candidatus Babeliaceae bacterium]|nr:amino acid permease [Candidatus Babeliaceae bacterium]
MTQVKHQKISLFMATIAGVNAMIGAGIFINPATLQQTVGPAAIITYIGVIAAVWVMALALARVAALYPKEGAFYTYAAEWGGHTMGVIASCAYMCGLTLAMSILTRVVALELAYYFPSVSVKLLGLITLWMLVALNMAGAALTKVGQIILIILTLAPVALITLLCLSKASLSNITPFMPFGAISLIYAIKSVIFGFFGFETAASLYALVDKPEKNVPRALSYSIVIVGSIYLLFIISIFLALPRELFALSGTTLSQALLTSFPNYVWLIDMVRISIIITIMGTLHALIWSLGELLCATTRRITRKTVLPLRTAVILIGISVTFNYLVFTTLGFALTALLLVFSYGTSIAALLFGPAQKNKSTKILGYAGLSVTLFIMSVALFEIITIITR